MCCILPGVTCVASTCAWCVWHQHVPGVCGINMCLVCVASTCAWHEHVPAIDICKSTCATCRVPCRQRHTSKTPHSNWCEGWRHQGSVRQRTKPQGNVRQCTKPHTNCCEAPRKRQATHHTTHAWLTRSVTKEVKPLDADELADELSDELACMPMGTSL